MAQRRFVETFQIGAISVELSTSIRGLHDQYRELYAAFRRPRELPAGIQVEAERSPFSLRRRRRYRVCVNGRLQFEPATAQEVLPYVEWAINWEIARSYPQFLQLHASSMEFCGRGVIFAGESGSGKSTLTLALLRRGWRYLCDEFALVHSGTLLLHPFPRAICVKRSGWELVRAMGIPVDDWGAHRNAKGGVRFIDPLRIRHGAVGRVCPVREVLFPKYERGAAPALTPMTRSEAVLELHRVCFNLFGCERIGIEVLTRMIRGTRCHRLRVGEPSATCEFLEKELLPTASAARIA